MSQQEMNYEEPNRGYQAQAPYSTGQEGSPGFDDAFSGFSGQKLGQYNFGRSASAGQRLALAIVSLCLLVPISAIVLGITTGQGGFVTIVGLIVMGIVCLTMMVVNLVFNLAHR
jgi:hypothetical protein